MPARTPSIGKSVAAQLASIGQRIRARRKRLRVSSTAASEAAGMSRVTLHRIERGEPSVAMGAYMSAIASLGLELELIDADESVKRARGKKGRVPSAIRLSEYPQLRRLAWQLKGIDEIGPREALQLYERNWRHIDQNAIDPHERELVRRLVDALDGERLLV